MSTSSKGKRVAVVLAVVVVVGLPIAAWLSWPHLRFWYLFESMGPNDQGLPEYKHRQTGIVMVRLPGGKFWMGAQKEDPEARNFYPRAPDWEGPVHAVRLSPFLIGKFEVRQVEWDGVMGNNPARYRADQLPVDNVSWDDCQGFCHTTGLRLPSEAQWEYACRAMTAGPFAGTGNLDDMGWYDENTRWFVFPKGKARPVGQKQPNDFGLHDMHGKEWPSNYSLCG